MGGKTASTAPCILAKEDAQTHATTVTAVPYYAWANREPGAMRVWLSDG